MHNRYCEMGRKCANGKKENQEWQKRKGRKRKQKTNEKRGENGNKAFINKEEKAGWLGEWEK